MRVDQTSYSWYSKAFTTEEREKIDGKLNYATYRVKHNLSNSEIKELLKTLKYFDTNNSSFILDQPYLKQFIEE